MRETAAGVWGHTMRIIRLAVFVGVVALLLRLGGLSDRAFTVLRDLGQQLTQLSRPTIPTGNASTREFRDSSVNIRSAPTTSSDVLGVGRTGDKVHIDRSVTGERVTCQDGHSTTEWLRIGDRRVSGFVSHCYL